ncbi:fatty acid oxidation complex alpha subunit [gamma proteobacterium HTCC5015]|nr:fatty acid oxidation complex alpha subunit [gamma proteobacterium HTCC5015]
MANQNAFSVEVRNDGVAIVTLDVPGESMNVLNASFADEAYAVLDQVENDPKVKASVFISGKDSGFIAGADVKMLQATTSAGGAAHIARVGQLTFQKMADSKKPIIAAIHGPALGGGYELALACHGRVASDSRKTVVGLPEVMLGVLPGSGGTQRLPRLIGLQQALPLILQGKQVKAFKGVKKGMVDKVVPKEQLLDTAIEMALGMVGKVDPNRSAAKKDIKDRLLEDNPIGRKVVFDQARKMVKAQTKGNYPAPLAIIDCIEYGLNNGLEKGLVYESKRFGELAMTKVARNLMRVFFTDQELARHDFTGSKGADIQQVGVLGGGLMGAGIGTVSLFNAKKSVIIKDRDEKGIGNANQHIKDAADKKLKFQGITEQEHRELLSKYQGVIEYEPLKDCDIIVEAVFENLELKHQMIQDVEANCKDDVVFATNTSSLPLKDIAAAAKRPEQVVAMHYFSPVEKMPLLEIVKHDKTADWVVSTAVDLGRAQGKKVIVVKDGAGFYVNRMLFPYANEIAWMAMEGVPLDQLDKAMVKAGFPVGPISLLDEVGVDVAGKVQPNLLAQFGERFEAPDMSQKLLDANRLGRKTKKGMYLYDQETGKKLKEIDPAVYTLLGVEPNKKISDAEIRRRSLLPLLNEAVRCLEDGTITSPRDGDLGAIFGIGFIPFSGGPFRMIDAMGAGAVVNSLQRYEELYGMRFTPCDMLLDYARNAKTFYES